MSTTPFSSRRRRAKLPPIEYDEQGRKRCRTCHEIVEGRGIYCRQACRDEFLLKRNPRHVAIRLRQLSGHRCAGCGADELDCFARYQQAVELLLGTPCESLLAPFVMWQADHVRPVSDGGGETGIENYRLLCPLCHGGVTHRLMEDRKTRVAPGGPWAAAARSARQYKQELPGGRKRP